jgi:hypothetical protein
MVGRHVVVDRGIQNKAMDDASETLRNARPPANQGLTYTYAKGMHAQISERHSLGLHNEVLKI